MDYELEVIEKAWEKAHRLEAMTGKRIPDCGVSSDDEGVDCKMPINHTGPHVCGQELWFVDSKGDVVKPEKWYEDHPS